MALSGSMKTSVLKIQRAHTNAEQRHAFFVGHGCLPDQLPRHLHHPNVGPARDDKDRFGPAQHLEGLSDRGFELIAEIGELERRGTARDAQDETTRLAR